MTDAENPHHVPRIACGKCGTTNHIDATTGEYQGRCRECFGFLRRPTEDELREFYAFIEWNTIEADASQ